MTDPTETEQTETGQSTRITEVARDGFVFDVIDTGPLDGDVVVLSHGFPERAASWSRVTAILNEAGLRTVAMDQRGYSPRARPTRRRDYRAPELVADLLALVDAASPARPVHLVGHDWGAIPSWLLAAHHADRVSSLTAVSVPHPMAFLSSMVRSTQLLHSWYMALFQVPFVPERVMSSRAGFADRLVTAFGMTTEEVERFRADIVDYGALPTALNWYRALPLTDPRYVRRGVGVPTTMVWSDQDVALERWGPENTDRWVHGAHFEFVALEGVSHWIPSQAPEPLAEAILGRVHAS